MTGAGSPGGPGIIQALKKNTKINLHIADANPNASGRYISNDCFFHQLPMAGSENFIETLLNLCINKKISVILPLVTKELFILDNSFIYGDLKWQNFTHTAVGAEQGDQRISQALLVQKQ